MKKWLFNPFTGKKLKRKMKQGSKATKRITNRAKKKSFRGQASLKRFESSAGYNDQMRDWGL